MRLQIEVPKVDSKLQELTAKLAGETQKAAQAQSGWDQAQKISDNQSRHLTKLTQSRQLWNAEKSRREELLEVSQSKSTKLGHKVSTLKMSETALKGKLERYQTSCDITVQMAELVEASQSRCAPLEREVGTPKHRRPRRHFWLRLNRR